MSFLDPETLKKRLRYQGQQYSNGSVSRGGGGAPHMLTQAADRLEALENQLRELCIDYQNLENTKPGKYCCCGECQTN